MRPNSRSTALRALVSWPFSLLTLETLDSVAMFAGGLAEALMEEAATWLVHDGALALKEVRVSGKFVLAADTYFLLSRTFICPYHGGSPSRLSRVFRTKEDWVS